MTQPNIAPAAPIDLEQDLFQTLSKLAEPSACLAVAADMEKAVVVRDTPDGKTMWTAIVDREVAEALALKDWITCAVDGRIARYHITPAGRVALKDHVAKGGDVDCAGLDEPNTDVTVANEPGRKNSLSLGRKPAFGLVAAD